jgi:hypothetical protein
MVKKPLKRFFVKVSLFHDHMWKTRLDMKREKCLEWPGMLHKRVQMGILFQIKLQYGPLSISTNKSLNFKGRFSEDIHAYPCAEGLKETEI